MDTTSLLVVIVVVIAVVLVILYLFRRGASETKPSGSGGETKPGSNTFTFAPSDEKGGVPLVKRRVTILARDQIVRGQVRKLVVDALPLPADPSQPPPKGKDIDRLVTSVIHPRVRYEDSREILSDFDPPLTISITYDKADAEMSGEIEGKPRLSIVTFYQEGDVWRWQKLRTEVDAERMTITANLQTLTPKDPVGMGHP
jgi:hypothetical protein